eukprot:CAMPEP_0119300572 /NCGR_PEP_ID=MMETSP1333-20130426/2500_1 /TAXON_ID=418940 /ORGANISM="Scyphosphaera apsteinii, Strain RCC1455" /LENGTH=291 /DNA_ID=CAMNT_0007302395 /DNA_START=230 /DNA_END=1105 /DNA_ORIENTATION=-
MAEPSWNHVGVTAQECETKSEKKPSVGRLSSWLYPCRSAETSPHVSWHTRVALRRRASKGPPSINIFELHQDVIQELASLRDLAVCSGPGFNIHHTSSMEAIQWLGTRSCIHDAQQFCQAHERLERQFAPERQHVLELVVAWKALAQASQTMANMRFAAMWKQRQECWFQALSRWRTMHTKAVSRCKVHVSHAAQWQKRRAELLDQWLVSMLSMSMYLYKEMVSLSKRRGAAVVLIQSIIRGYIARVAYQKEVWIQYYLSHQMFDRAHELGWSWDTVNYTQKADDWCCVVM